MNTLTLECFGDAGGRGGVPGTQRGALCAERRDQLDAVLIVPLERWLGAPVQWRLSAENILNTPFEFTQGPVVQERYTSGVKFTVSLSLRR